jgi:hypothetical protein
MWVSDSAGFEMWVSFSAVDADGDRLDGRVARHVLGGQPQVVQPVGQQGRVERSERAVGDGFGVALRGLAVAK